MKYDPEDPSSIEAFAKKAVGHTLREVADVSMLTFKRPGKGGFGQTLEEAYFGIFPGNSPEPDFRDAGVELKSFPLRRLKSGKLVAKERISLGMIDYVHLVTEKWEQSSFLRKNALLLLVAYEYEKDVDFRDLTIRAAGLWPFPDVDMKIIKDDWTAIRNKVRDGLAHELSEGDTLYLGAAPKGGKDQKPRAQPYGPGAKPRALTLKQPYVTDIAAHLLRRTEHSPAVASTREYKTGETFEGYVVRRFAPYIGKTSTEIHRRLGGTLNPSAKNYHEALTRKMLGVEGRKIEEFEKAGVIMKTVRLEKSGVPKESMAFPAFKFKELVEEKWENSTFRNTLSQRFFFVVFQRNEKNELVLKKVMFWSMPVSVLDGEVRRVWQATVRCIKEGRLADLPKQSESTVCHVRTHGKNKKDTDITPDGRRETKRCFWLDRKYIAEQIGDGVRAR